MTPVMEGRLLDWFPPYRDVASPDAHDALLPLFNAGLEDRVDHVAVFTCVCHPGWAVNFPLCDPVRCAGLGVPPDWLAMAHDAEVAHWSMARSARHA